MALKGQNLGNKNAAGNAGGGGFNQKNKKKAAALKGIVIDWAMKQMKKKDTIKGVKERKEAIVLRLLPTCVPRSIEVTGEDGDALQINIIKYGDSSRKISTKKLPNSDK